MNELVKLSAAVIGGEEQQTVNARDLWTALESKQEFSKWIKNRLAECLPRARGGVSERKGGNICHIWSSPRTRGCFYSAAGLTATPEVFPAHAGVFLAIAAYL